MMLKKSIIASVTVCGALLFGTVSGDMQPMRATANDLLPDASLMPAPAPTIHDHPTYNATQRYVLNLWFAEHPDLQTDSQDVYVLSMAPEGYVITAYPKGANTDETFPIYEAFYTPGNKPGQGRYFWNKKPSWYPVNNSQVSQSTNASQPTQLEQPTNTQPTQPQQKSQLTNASQPTQPVQPTNTQPTQPQQMSQLTNASQPTQPVQPTSPTPVMNNQGRQPNIDYQTPVNAGYLDGATADNNGDVIFTGWHATNQYQRGMYHYVIALNASNNQELYRSEAQTVYRPDVARVYSKAPVAAEGGFNFAMPATSLQGVNSVRLVSRYTNDATGNPAGGADFWFTPVTTNAGWLDNFKVQGNQVLVSGWHAADAAAVKGAQHYLILFDRTANRELARQTVTNTASDDVAKAGYKTANAENARFNATFAVTPAMINHQLALVSRYADGQDANAAGHYTDLWFNNGPVVHNNNQAWLDNFSVNGSKIDVSGWNANEMSAAYPTHFLILFDQTKNHEVAHQIVTDQASPDVARAYGDVYNAGKSRFSATFNVTPAMMGDTFVLVSRYSDSNNTNNYGHYSDYWLTNKKVSLANKQAAYLDNAQVNPTNNTIYVSGWHAADASAILPYHYLILYDRTTNREVGRQRANVTASNDVAAHGYGDIANSNHSRFAATFNITPAMIGDQLVVVSRYTDNAAHGEGNKVDYWFNNRIIEPNLSLD